MKNRYLCFLAILVAIVIVAAPAAAGVYSSRVSSIYSEKASSFGLGVKDPAKKLSYLSSLQGMEFKTPEFPTFSEPGSHVFVVPTYDGWNSFFSPPMGCNSCGCS